MPVPVLRENRPPTLLPGLTGPIPLSIPGLRGFVHTFHLAAPESSDFLYIFPTHKSTIHPQVGMLFLFLSCFPQTANFGLHWERWQKPPWLLGFVLCLFLGGGES